MDLNVFAEIGFLVVFATLVAFIMRVLKQPLIIGHIITGFLVGRFALGIFQNIETLELFSELGISFLLFSVGLSLNPKVLKEYGKAAFVTGIGQVLLTGTVGVFVCMLLGFDWITSLYVGVALAFSSTVIVLKLLSDKGDLDKLYVKLSIGSLLLQDLIAIILLFAIPFVTGSQGSGVELVKTLGLAFAVGIFVFLFVHFVVRHLHVYLTKSHELLFLFANAWGMGIAALFAGIGLSLEGGALIAGVALSTLPSRHEISARLAPLRDFFIVAFFVLLGTRMVVSDFNAILIPALILSVFVLIGNPLLQLIVMGTLGYKKKTSFQTGTMAAQISEFSLILVALGVSLGQVSKEVLSMVTLVGLITIFISSYLILYSDKIYKYIGKYLQIFERKDAKERSPRTKSFHIFLIGAGRTGYEFINLFKEDKKNLLVIEHDPEVIGQLSHEKIEHVYGDASDPDLLDELKVHNAELVISTLPDLETNLIILSNIKREKNPPVVMMVAHRATNALQLYEAGADYVVLPHFIGGTYATSLVKKFRESALEFKSIKDEHIEYLKNRIKTSQEHASLEKLR
ncbi:MAG TPA: cation:proton antiporter [Parcubacteria group bacterium]|jgi:Kef-type K+ transport system membrane component KefB/Trk K+ transport system NAD-binding subunit|nr:cation:proton antiporter [Parcubacteria group bacterium]